MIYFDNAATTLPKPPEVIRAVVEAMESFGNPSRGAHEAALKAGRKVEECRDRLAAMFNCPDPARIAFTKNVTEALNLAINSVGGHIVSSQAEHNSVLRPLFRRKNFSLVEVDDLGRYQAEDVARAIRPDTQAVVLAQASNLTGNLAPFEEIGAICRDRKLLFIVDAAQSAGLFKLDMQALSIDALCFTGHKSLYGPQGTGGICLSPAFTPEPPAVGGSGSHSFESSQPSELPDLLEAGTLNAHGLAGLAAGLAYVERNWPALAEETLALARRFYEGARQIDGAVFYGDYQAPLRAPIVTLNLGAMPADEAAGLLEEDYGLAVRAGAHCAPLLHRRFGTEKQGALRFSFSSFNRPEEIDLAVAALKKIAEKAPAR